MYYATPNWMQEQIPERVLNRYEIHFYKYGQPLTLQHNPETTALIGFSAGGLDVLKNYQTNYALVALIDPTTQKKYADLNFGVNTVIVYNSKNWGKINQSLETVARKINACGGLVIKSELSHSEIPKHFFNNYFYEKNR